MIIEELNKRLENKLEFMQHDLSYQIESLSALMSALDSIRYLLFLKEKFKYADISLKKDSDKKEK